MLKKLYKHEFYSLFRTLVPIYGALIGFALLSRIMYFIKTDNTVLKVFRGLSTTVYVFSIIAMFIVGLVVIVMRFYKNLLSHEGYLTFSLPFTATKHITCKLLCGVTVIIINFIATVASLLILGAGTDTLKQVLNGIKEAFNMGSSVYSDKQITLFIVEIAVLLIIGCFESLLMFYAAMAVGQQFKNKVLAAVVSYIVFYAVIQVLTSLTIVPVTISNADKFNDYMNSGIEAVGTFLLFVIGFNVILSVVYFFITRYFLTKKLNLE